MRNALKFACLTILSIPLLANAAEPKPGARVERKGDEIIVCGQLFHTGTPVVTWLDPGGYDAYRVELKFAPLAKSSWNERLAKNKDAEPARYSMRKAALKPEQAESIHAHGWTLPELQGVVDQFVLHYDVCGTSKRCFDVLHDHRDLSVHFMLDLDGTIYQTLDLKENAWHATKANSRSVGIEIANMGAEPVGKPNGLGKWYHKEGGKTLITIPGPANETGIRDKSVVLAPSRPDLVIGNIQGQNLEQYDLTPQQYEALIKLTATLHAVFPKIKLDYPRDAQGKLLTVKMPDDAYKSYEGILGHFHVQTNKTDPGPAFQFDKLIEGVKAIEAAK